MLLNTVHGSTLYGLNHDKSDEDRFIVTEFGKSKQILNADDDVVLFNLKDFRKKITKGSHQAIEAAFSPIAEVSADLKPWLDGLRVYSSEIDHAYMRTIKSMCLDRSTFKKKRHAVRLTINLSDLRAYGRFNPRMTKGEVMLATTLATSLSDKQLWASLSSYLDNTRFVL